MERLLQIGISASGFLLVASGVTVVCALALSPLVRRHRDKELLEITNPVELGWASTARLRRPATAVLLGSLALNLVLRVLHSAL